MSNIKVTQKQIDDLLAGAEFHTQTLFGKQTVVTAKLANGFVLSESTGCVNPANYEEVLGVEICKKRIIDRLWMLEGYALQKKLHDASGMSGVSFSRALDAVKTGKGMRLPKWSPDVVIRCQRPDEHSKMTAPYLYVESRFGKVPWKETMIELFSEDWEVVD